MSIADDLLARGDIDRLVLMAYERKRASVTTLPQPDVTVTVDDWQAVADYFHHPADPSDDLVGFDVLLQSVKEAIDSGREADALFAALRVVRKEWQLQPHLGPLEGVGTQAANAAAIPAPTVWQQPMIDAGPLYREGEDPPA